jgi:phosphoenolpyruvate carboxykinase (GTP)
LPKIFHVNWFRKGEDGQFLWPGFGENLRVLEWMIERVQGKARAIDTPIGMLPDLSQFNLQGVELPQGASLSLFDVDLIAWKAEFEEIGAYLRSYGDSTPAELHAEAQRILATLS